MNKNKGFTLIELLGTIVILGIIALVVTPPIINQIKSAKNKVSASSVQYVYSTGESFVKENLNDYSMTVNSVICIKVSDLVDNDKIKDGYIKENNIDSTSAVKFTVDSNGKLVGDTSLYNTTCTTKVKTSLPN